MLKNKATVESMLLMTTFNGDDSVAIKQQVGPLLAQAQKDNNIPILWAYNMLMADMYSIIYDTTNPVTDQYYREAAQLLKEGNYPELEFIGKVRQGHYHFIYRKISEAFPYFLAANFIQPKIDEKITPLLLDHYAFAAGFYNYIGNHERAIEYLEMALPHTAQGSRRRIDMLNSLSVYYKQQAKTTVALQYSEMSLAEAEAAKDSVWIGIISGNLSEYRWKQGRQQEALALLKKNIALSTQFEENLDVMRANLQIAKYYIALKDFEEATRHIRMSLALMEDKPYFLVYRGDAMKYLADIAFLQGDFEAERKYLKSYLALKTQIDEQIDNEEIKKISWKFEIEKYEETLLLNALKEKELKRTYSLIGLSLFLLAVVVVLLMVRSRHKVKIKNIKLENAQLQFAYEKQLLNNELVTVRNSLTEFTEKINQNNIVISGLRKELANAVGLDEQVKNRMSDELAHMLKSHLMTQERWIDFKAEFDHTYPNYLYNLKVNNPALTENDMRIIALTKLNLNNRSIADLLGISLEGVKKAKQRLKKKMEMPDA